MKIGIQILAYNCESTFEKLIEPWVKLKEQYDIKIWVGSGQFKIYNDMGCENLNGPTIKLLGKLLKENKINYIFQPDPDNLLGDHTTRDKCIPWMKDNDIDLMIQVDADEFYTYNMAKGYLNFIKNNPESDCYNTIFKNIMSKDQFEDWSRFSAGWIKRNDGIRGYYLDAHWYFNNDKEYRWVPTIDVPKEICYPSHYTWDNDSTTTGPSHIKEKIEYQKIYYNGECSYEWDDVEDKLIKKGGNGWQFSKVNNDGTVYFRNISGEPKFAKIELCDKTSSYVVEGKMWNPNVDYWVVKENCLEGEFKVFNENDECIFSHFYKVKNRKQ